MRISCIESLRKAAVEALEKAKSLPNDTDPYSSAVIEISEPVTVKAKAFLEHLGNVATCRMELHRGCCVVYLCARFLLEAQLPERQLTRTMKDVNSLYTKELVTLGAPVAQLERAVVS